MEPKVTDHTGKELEPAEVRKVFEALWGATTKFQPEPEFLQTPYTSRATWGPDDELGQMPWQERKNQ